MLLDLFFVLGGVIPLLKGIISILGGVIASSSFILSKKPNVKKTIDIITPYQGLVGVMLIFIGALSIFGMLVGIGSVDSIGTVGLITIVMLMPVMQFFIGFSLVYSQISKYLLERNKIIKGEGLIAYQIHTGIALIIMGVLLILYKIAIFLYFLILTIIYSY